MSEQIPGSNYREQLKQEMVDFLEKAHSKIPQDSWQRLNDTLGAVASALKEKQSPEGPLKTFVNMAGRPPLNADDELMIATDRIINLARKIQ